MFFMIIAEKLRAQQHFDYLVSSSFHFFKILKYKLIKILGFQPLKKLTKLSKLYLIPERGSK